MNAFKSTTRLSIERIDLTWHTRMEIVLGNGERLDLELQLPLQEHPSPTIADLNRQVFERAQEIIGAILKNSN